MDNIPSVMVELGGITKKYPLCFVNGSVSIKETSLKFLKTILHPSDMAEGIQIWCGETFLGTCPYRCWSTVVNLFGAGNITVMLEEDRQLAPHLYLALQD